MELELVLILTVVLVLNFAAYKYILPKLRSYFLNRPDPGKKTMTPRQTAVFIFVWLLGASGFLYYYLYCDDLSVLLECRKETMTCAYSRTTRKNKQLHFVKTYDMKDIGSVSVNCHHQKGGGSSCQIHLYKKDSRWSTQSFSFALNHGAAKQLETELNLFLSTDQPEYSFYKEN